MGTEPASTSNLQIGRSRYCVHSFGEGLPGVLALHGFTGSGLDFAPFADQLGALVHCPDLPGHGDTVSGEQADFGIEAAADELACLSREMGLHRPVLLGYSMGARTALTLSCRQPEFARALVLIGSSPGLEGVHEREARCNSDERLARELEAAGTEAFIGRWQDLPLLRSQQRMDPQQWQEFSARRRLADPKGLAFSLRTLGTGRMPQLWDSLAGVLIPALLITGEQDVRYTAIARRMAARMPRASCSVIGASGHSPHLERPAAVAGVVAGFLAALAPGI